MNKICIGYLYRSNKAYRLTRGIYNSQISNTDKIIYVRNSIFKASHRFSDHRARFHIREHITRNCLSCGGILRKNLTFCLANVERFSAM